MTDPELAELGPVELDGFEVWDRYVQAPAGSGKKVAFVSVRVGGVVGLNKAAREMLGHCDAVRVMYDPKRLRLGIVPADPEARDSYQTPDWHWGTQLSCRRMFEFYGVEIAETRRCYDLEMVDGVLVANLERMGS